MEEKFTYNGTLNVSGLQSISHRSETCDFRVYGQINKIETKTNFFGVRIWKCAMQGWIQLKVYNRKNGMFKEISCHTHQRLGRKQYQEHTVR